MKRYTQLNGLTFSACALDAMYFGTRVSPKKAFRTLDTFLDIDGNFIDTAINYAYWTGTGDESETLIGR